MRSKNEKPNNRKSTQPLSWSKWMGPLITLLLITTFFTGTLYASDPTDGKVLGIRESHPSHPLTIDFKPYKNSYKVDEPIHFSVRGNQEFFFYLFTINRELNRAIMLIPGIEQKENKYPKNRTIPVPNKGLEFFSDRPGTEEVVALASTRYIDFDRKKFTKSGNFFTATPEVVDTQVKALGIRYKKEKRETEMVIKQVKLTIKGKPAPVTASVVVPPKPIVFVSSVGNRYHTGDVIKWVYGADHTGWVHLYSWNPDGELSFLKREKVNGKNIYDFKTKAIPPAGRHALVAVFTDDDAKRFQEKSIASLADETRSTKSLVMFSDQEKEPVYAVYRFDVSNGSY